MPSRKSREADPAFNKQDAVRFMSTTGWLAHCPPHFRQELLSRTRLLGYPKDGAIYRAEDEPSGIYGLVSGQVRFEMGVFEVGEQVALVAQPGSWFGVASLIGRRRQVLTLSCTSRSTLLYLTKCDFEELASNADGMRCFAQLAVENSDLILSFARDLMNSDIRARIASRLIAIFGGVEDSSRLIDITQAELAMVCNISRKTVNQELAQLERMGVLSRAYRRLVVEDADALRRIADGHAVHIPTSPIENVRGGVAAEGAVVH